MGNPLQRSARQPGAPRAARAVVRRPVLYERFINLYQQNVRILQRIRITGCSSPPVGQWASVHQWACSALKTRHGQSLKVGRSKTSQQTRGRASARCAWSRYVVWSTFLVQRPPRPMHCMPGVLLHSQSRSARSVPSATGSRSSLPCPMTKSPSACQPPNSRWRTPD